MHIHLHLINRTFLSYLLSIVAQVRENVSDGCRRAGDARHGIGRCCWHSGVAILADATLCITHGVHRMPCCNLWQQYGGGAQQTPAILSSDCLR